MISKNEIPISAACSSLGVNRSTYYDNLRKSCSTGTDDTSIKDIIQEIILEFPRYGYRRIAKEMHRRGQVINHKKVLRIMRENNLLCAKKKFRVCTTDSDHNYFVYPNLTKDITLTGINQLWAADITYVHLVKEHVYLAVILDVFSRKCIGWDLHRHIDTYLALTALNMAIDTRLLWGVDGLIHHSDQGVQYASYEYIDLLKKYDIRISMSRKGNPYDNAFAESFIKTLKTEEVYVKEYKNIADAYQNIKEFIEMIYNKKRLHSSIGYMPPEEYEKEVLKANIRYLGVQK